MHNLWLWRILLAGRQINGGFFLFLIIINTFLHLRHWKLRGLIVWLIDNLNYGGALRRFRCENLKWIFHESTRSQLSCDRNTLLIIQGFRITCSHNFSVLFTPWRFVCWRRFSISNCSRPSSLNLLHIDVHRERLNPLLKQFKIYLLFSWHKWYILVGVHWIQTVLILFVTLAELNHFNRDFLLRLFLLIALFRFLRLHLFFTVILIFFKLNWSHDLFPF